jgi:OOP family OmpA-OmpF porin
MTTTTAPPAASDPSSVASTQAATDTGALSVQSSATTAGDSAPVVGGAAAGAQVAAETQEKPWIEQLQPVDNLVELGLVAGLMFPSSSLNLQSQYSAHQTLSVAPELGVRGAYFPIKYVGAELEYVVGFSKTNTDDTGAQLWALRAHVIGQFPEWRVTPFALLGAGRLGVFSSGMGNDADPLFHFGVGAKAALTPDMLVRLDLRDNMSQKYGASDGTQTHSFEILAGVSLILGRPDEPPAVVAVDTDGDGLVDRVDKCPMEPGVGADGCPVKDMDADGVADTEDKCPDVKGNPPDGCPIVKDTDADGVPDDKDKCLEQKGDPPDGCPGDKDSDSDGILDSKDKCPNEAESRNGFEDTDGCPDELPTQVKEFTGVLKGIEFDRDKATISPASLPALDKSALVLSGYPSLRVLITGHTDDTGGREKNLQLSKARAEAVKAYFVSKGIDTTRIETRGAGSDEPLDSNATAAGRQRNRRIEIKLLKDSE